MAVTTSYTGTTTFPSSKRNFFFVVMTTGTGTIAFGPGGAEIPLAEGFHYSPTPVSSEVITITGGTYTVQSDQVVV